VIHRRSVSLSFLVGLPAFIHSVNALIDLPAFDRFLKPPVRSKAALSIQHSAFSPEVPERSSEIGWLIADG
jgi:hypothetical protein